jgi:two-component system, NarL family, response regulator DegU
MVQTKIKVVIAEDSDIVRMGIRNLLKNAQDIELIGEARNGLEALQIVGEVQPDVLLLDVEMPYLDGIAVTRVLKTIGPARTRILVLSAYNDKEYIREMLLNGASGYLLKDEAPERIVEAVQGIALGETGWVTPREKIIPIKKSRKGARR